MSSMAIGFFTPLLTIAKVEWIVVFWDTPLFETGVRKLEVVEAIGSL